jgi:hypothetical protein
MRSLSIPEGTYAVEARDEDDDIGSSATVLIVTLNTILRHIGHSSLSFLRPSIDDELNGSARNLKPPKISRVAIRLYHQRQAAIASSP